MYRLWPTPVTCPLRVSFLSGNPRERRLEHCTSCSLPRTRRSSRILEILLRSMSQRLSSNLTSHGIKLVTPILRTYYFDSCMLIKSTSDRLYTVHCTHVHTYTYIHMYVNLLYMHNSYYTPLCGGLFRPRCDCHVSCCSCGSVSVEQLRAVCSELGTPISEEEVQDVLKE